MAVSDELNKLYADAFEKGLFVKEYPSKDGCIAFAGVKRKLHAAGFDTKEKLNSIDLVNANVFMAGAGGDTREEAVQEAINNCVSSEDWIPTK